MDTADRAAERPWRAVLRSLWARCLADRAGTTHGDAGRRSEEWPRERTVMLGLGLGFHETLSFVYRTAPTFEQLERWVLERNGGALDDDLLARLDAALLGTSGNDEPPDAVLSAADLAFFAEHGYVIVREAVMRAQAAAAEDAIWEFIGADRDDPATWYRGPQGHSIWVPLLRHPAFELNRRSPRIRGAFAQLWGRSDLWATTDQGGFNPPQHAGWRFPGPNLHWDTGLVPPVPFGLQGILYLVDVAPDQGAFTCVPGFHRRIDAWLAALPPGADPQKQDLDALGRAPVSANAGDLVIWHHALPHGSSPNRAARPRIVQYITLRPGLGEEEPRWS
ncbi:MAG TPA: phytanoyl-CoA dioxygenase family protein [Candidatus Baltobacteraceae bacterium]|nr:phytanoyl-CoA dioxygenase family protein [Candidatus Baltobacteraceae bacterium]